MDTISLNKTVQNFHEIHIFYYALLLILTKSSIKLQIAETVLHT